MLVPGRPAPIGRIGHQWAAPNYRVGPLKFFRRTRAPSAPATIPEPSVGSQSKSGCYCSLARNILPSRHSRLDLQTSWVCTRSPTPSMRRFVVGSPSCPSPHLRHRPPARLTLFRCRVPPSRPEQLLSRPAVQYGRHDRWAPTLRHQSATSRLVRHADRMSSTRSSRTRQPRPFCPPSVPRPRTPRP